MSIPNSTRFTPALSAGGAASFETRCQVGTAPEELALTLGCDDTGSGEGRTTTDWSVIFGFGIDYHRGVIVLSLDARYGFGLVELGTVAGLKNRGGTVALGVRVPAGR